MQPKDRAQVMKIISGSYDACFSSLAAVLRQDSKDVHANGFDDDGRKVDIISSRGVPRVIFTLVRM